MKAEGTTRVYKDDTRQTFDDYMSVCDKVIYKLKKLKVIFNDNIESTQEVIENYEVQL